MSDLLTGVVRVVNPVKLSSRVVHIRQLTAIELMAMQDQLVAAGDDKAKLIAVQVSAYLSNEDGSKALTDDQSAQFVNLYSGLDVKRIIKAGSSLNSIDDEAVEQAAKN
jgi:hypothetical protein